MIFDVKRIGKRTALMLAVMILSFNLSACGSTGEVQPDAADKSEEAAEMTAEGGTAGADSGSDDNITAAEEDTAQNADQNSEQRADQRVDELLANMTLRDKVEQMMIVPYRIWKEVPDKTDEALSQTVNNTEDEIPAVNVTELNDAIREDIRKHNYGGTILYAQNYKDAEQSLKLIADIQQTAVDSGSVPLIVGTDQEGGRVSRLGFGTSGVGNMALSATGNAENAKKMAQIYGNELSLLGVNTDFAPVVDVNDNPNNPVIGDRSFSDDPEIVSAFGIAYMEGLKDTGTIATLKHFPGHGNTDTDSHTGFPCIQSSYDELKKSELIPFQKAIDAGADMIMTDHIQYPEIEKQTYTSITTGEEVCLPATMSRTILTDILRKDMGFEGVIVTDALDMASITENFEIEDVIKLAINAGVDMLIYPSITDTDIFRKTQEMTETAVRLAEDGEIDAQRIDESVRRILTLKEKYGILDKKDFTVTEQQIEAAENGIGRQASDEEVLKIAGEAVTVLKNDDDTLPISMAEGEKALILFSESSADSTANAEIAKKYLAEKNLIPEKAEITVSVNTAGNEEDCLKAAEEADHVILVHKMLKASNLDPSTDDGYSSGVFDKIIKACHDKGKKVVLISCRLPYDAARFTDADAVILSYSTSAITEIPPEKGEGSAYIPSLPIAIEAAFGAVEAKGKLPVNIPEIGKDYKFTDKILYERSN